MMDDGLNNNAIASPSGGLRALVIEADFSCVFRPADISRSLDDRLLALGLIKIEIVAADGQVSAPFDFAGSVPKGAHLLYGMSEPEDWGVWNNGKRAAILLTVEQPLRPTDRLRIRYMTQKNAPAVTQISLRCNGAEQTLLPLDGRDLEFALGAAAFASPAAQHGQAPEACVIIVNRDRADLTIAASLLATANAGCPIELIIVENGSAESSWRELQAASLPARLIRLAKGVSFGEANNMAAEQAAGRFLLFLNNDAFLQPGCLSSLVCALERDPAITAAGPIFHYPDGRLQEAGGYVAADCRVFRIANDDARLDLCNLPQVSEVDYVSAACLVFRKDAFLSLGGFDHRYDPAYFEDVDLCLRAKSRGGLVKLLRDARVIHIANATSADPAIRFPLHEAISLNAENFQSRWQDWLLDGRPIDSSDLMEVAVWDGAAVKRTADPHNAVVLLSDDQADEEWGLSVAAALASDADTILVPTTRRSLARFSRIAGDLGLESGCAPVVPIEDCYGRHFANIIYICRQFPPDRSAAAALKSARTIVYCVDEGPPPGVSDQEIERRITALAQSDLLICASRTALRYCKNELRRLRGPALSKAILRPPFPAVPMPLAKDHLVVALARLGRTTADDLLCNFLRCFQRFTWANASPWRLVVALEASLGYDPLVLARLRTQAVRLGVRLIVNPPAAAMAELLARARICVSLPAERDLEGYQDAPRSTRVSIAAAVAARCVPVVERGTTDFELVEEIGMGLGYSSLDEVDTRLRQAAELAECDGLGAVAAKAAERFGFDAFRTRLAALVAGEAGALLHDPSPAAHVGRPAALMVLGMHRSGTSAMARALSLSGAALPHRLMPPQEDNPTGFWEPSEVVALNEAILARAGLRWDDIFVQQLAGRPLAHDQGDLAAARQIIRANYEAERPIVLKDPRLSLLAPLWEEALLREGYQPHYVIMVRSPWEVARSLAVRNRLPHSTGMLLYAAYLVAAEAHSRGRSRVFAQYTALLDQPEHTLETIQNALNINLPFRGEAATADIEATLKHELRTHRDCGEERAGAFGPVWNLYDAVVAACHGADLSDDRFAQAQAWLNTLHEVVGLTLTHLKGETPA